MGASICLEKWGELCWAQGQGPEILGQIQRGLTDSFLFAVSQSLPELVWCWAQVRGQGACWASAHGEGGGRWPCLRLPSSSSSLDSGQGALWRRAALGWAMRLGAGQQPGCSRCSTVQPSAGARLVVAGAAQHRPAGRNRPPPPRQH